MLKNNIYVIRAPMYRASITSKYGVQLENELVCIGHC